MDSLGYDGESGGEGRDWEGKSCRDRMVGMRTVVGEHYWPGGSQLLFREWCWCYHDAAALLGGGEKKREWKRQPPALAALWNTWDSDLSPISSHVGLSGEHHTISRNCTTNVQLFPFISLQSLLWWINAELSIDIPCWDDNQPTTWKGPPKGENNCWHPHFTDEYKSTERLNAFSQCPSRVGTRVSLSCRSGAQLQACPWSSSAGADGADWGALSGPGPSSPWHPVA